MAGSQVEVQARVSIGLARGASHMLCKLPLPMTGESFIFFPPVISRCVQGTAEPQTFLLSLLVVQNLHLAIFDYECFLWLFCGSRSKYSKQFKNT